MKTVGYLTERGQFYASLTAMPKHEQEKAKPLVFAADAREPKLRAALIAISEACIYSPTRGAGMWDGNLARLIEHHARQLTAGVAGPDHQTKRKAGTDE